MADTIEFVNGLIVKAPRDGAPDFVKAAISIKVADLIAWLQGRDDEWVNIDVKEARSGKWYAAVNSYNPKAIKKAEKPIAEKTSIADMDSDIPF
jgi:phenylpyruvate tautomerase PptA (4-oxalocrotonate tautomerase family)